jgi:predicted lipoprotein
MKKVLSLVLVFAAVVSFNSCKKANTPEATAEAYLTHVAKMEFEKAKEFVTEDSKATIDFLAQMAGMAGEEAKKEAANAKIEIKDMKCEVTEDKAVCNCMVVNGEKEEKETLNLVKQGDKWLVVQSKEGPGMDMEEEETVEAEEVVEAPVAE